MPRKNQPPSEAQVKARAEKKEAFLAGKRAAAATHVSSGFGGPDRAPLDGCSSKPSSVHPTGTVDPASHTAVYSGLGEPDWAPLDLDGCSSGQDSAPSDTVSQVGSIPAAFAGSSPAAFTTVNSSLGGLDGAPIEACSSKPGSVHPTGTVVTASQAGSSPAASTGSIPAALTMWQKVEADERDVWQYLLSHGYKPEDCHNGMFPPCSVGAHTVAALIAMRRKVELLRDSMDHLNFGKGPGGKCLPKLHEELPGAKASLSILSGFECKVPSCPGVTDIPMVSMERAIAIMHLPDSEMWKAVLKSPTGKHYALFQCSARCNLHGGQDHCLRKEHLLLETVAKNAKRRSHHNGDAACHCALPCLGGNVVHETTAKEIALADGLQRTAEKKKRKAEKVAADLLAISEHRNPKTELQHAQLQLHYAERQAKRQG
ncbi:hypothetical protein LTR85_005724 [Meristemomyces frigidus]|nr:hypothetical protein LTR85_005724 [Meristemomyces frigidus]